MAKKDLEKMFGTLSEKEAENLVFHLKSNIPKIRKVMTAVFQANPLYARNPDARVNTFLNDIFNSPANALVAVRDLEEGQPTDIERVAAETLRNIMGLDA